MKLKEIIKEGVKERQWIIKDLIPQGEIIILYAPTNQYKTFFSLKIALEIVTGSQELGITKFGKVTIYSPDTGIEDLILRIRGLKDAKYRDQKKNILECLDLDFDQFDLTQDHRIDEDNEIWTWSDIGQFSLDKESEKDIDCSLLIIDTLSQSIGSNGVNDDKSMREVFINLKKIIKGSNNFCSILLIAHAGKNGSKGIMGSSIQKNDVPTVLKIKKKKANQMELYREKIKSKLEGSSIPFKMRETAIDDQETLYVDIGSSLNEFENQIVSSTKLGNSKEETKEILYKLRIANTTTRKSFNTVFNRSWKKLADMGFFCI